MYLHIFFYRLEKGGEGGERSMQQKWGRG